MRAILPLQLSLLTLLKFCSAYSLFVTYKKMMHTCNLTNSFFLTVKGTSLIECASTCSQFEDCSRLAWNSTEKECMLHSELMMTSTNSIVSDVDFFSRGWNADCNIEGYDFEYTTRTCLKLFDGPAVSWTEARAICKQDGGDLISITTKLKWDFVYNYIRCATVAWIGLRNKTWTNEVLFDNVFDIQVDLNANGGSYTYANDTDFSCAAIFIKTNKAPLRDNSCNLRQRNRFVCELVI